MGNLLHHLLAKLWLLCSISCHPTLLKMELCKMFSKKRKVLEWKTWNLSSFWRQSSYNFIGKLGRLILGTVLYFAQWFFYTLEGMPTFCVCHWWKCPFLLSISFGVIVYCSQGKTTHCITVFNMWGCRCRHHNLCALKRLAKTSETEQPGRFIWLWQHYIKLQLIMTLQSDLTQRWVYFVYYSFIWWFDHHHHHNLPPISDSRSWNCQFKCCGFKSLLCQSQVYLGKNKPCLTSFMSRVSQLLQRME